jgi:septum site-determining protein MinD
MAGKIIGIISLKGGVGKTSSVANLGSVLATEFNKKVLVVDANFSSPNLGLHLGLVDPEVSIHHVLSNKVKAHEAIFEHESGFHLIPGSYISKKISPMKLKNKIKHLKSYYDLILLDSSPNLNEEILASMAASDELFVVTSPDYPTLSTTMRAVKLAKQKRTPISGLILNRVRNRHYELNVKDIEEASNVPVVGILPEDEKVLESLYYTTPVSLHKPNAKSSTEFKKLAAKIIGESYQDPRLWSRVKSFFRK